MCVFLLLCFWCYVLVFFAGSSRHAFISCYILIYVCVCFGSLCFWWYVNGFFIDFLNRPPWIVLYVSFCVVRAMCMVFNWYTGPHLCRSQSQHLISADNFTSWFNQISSAIERRISTSDLNKATQQISQQRSSTADLNWWSQQLVSADQTTADLSR